MRITANDKPHELDEGTTLGTFLGSLGLSPSTVVVERNGEVVRRTDAATTVLRDGDRLLVIRAVAGGADVGVGGGGAGGVGLPSLSTAGERRQARLRDARLYVVTDARRDRGDLEPFLRAVCAGSADIVQLRDKTATEDELRAAAAVFRRVCEDAGTLFVVNDLPGLAVDVGADGVHVGQQDVHPDHARHVVGPDLLVGRSTHGPEQLDGSADEDVDYVAVGPVHATPTKLGRPAIGLDPVRYAASHSSHPWFAIGGLDPTTLGPVLEAGAERIVVVRAVTEADDPEDACWQLRRLLAAA